LLVLHAIWENSLPARLPLWAETTPSGTASRVGKQSTRQKPGLHPFMLANDALLEAVDTLSSSPLAASAESGFLTLRLPSTTKGPLPSPELVLEQASEKPQTIEFRQWNVVTLRLDAGVRAGFSAGPACRRSSWYGLRRFSPLLGAGGAVLL
jgi:hypothetical protein